MSTKALAFARMNVNADFNERSEIKSSEQIISLKIKKIYKNPKISQNIPQANEDKSVSFCQNERERRF
jgi:hypothetical protein